MPEAVRATPERWRVTSRIWQVKHMTVHGGTITLGEGGQALAEGFVSPVEQVALPGEPSQGAGLPGGWGARRVCPTHQVHPPHAPHVRQGGQITASALQPYTTTQRS